MPKRQARPGGLTQDKPGPDIERADSIIARAAQGGPEFYARDIEAWRQQFLAERSEGKPSTYWAFMAVATAAARDCAELDRTREIIGLQPVEHYAAEVPHRMVELPLWAAVALMRSWMLATTGDVKERQMDPGPASPVPLAEAFGLAGESGSRTVGRHHLQDWRDRDVALEVERLRARNQDMTDNAARIAVAEIRNMTVSMVRRAHERYGGSARERLARLP